jgi:hypothetical protein
MSHYRESKARRYAAMQTHDAHVENLQQHAYQEGVRFGAREANMTLATFRANVDNESLSDAEFREFMRNCLK